MKLSTITLGFVALATLGTSAFAAPPDIARRQTELRGALAPFQFKLVGDRADFTPRGRRDLVMVSSQDRTSMVEELKASFHQRQTLPNGYRIIGWAHIDATDSYTFTMLNVKAQENHVVELFADPAGTKVKIWGYVNPVSKAAPARITVPTRFSPAGVDPIVR